MKIMIIGDSASGKSTFATTLAKKLYIPVIHIDEINDFIGRDKPNEIKEKIEEEIKKDNWIFDGNGFTKDKTSRIKNTDIVFVFNSNPFLTLLRHIIRYIKIKYNKEKRVGSNNLKLNLKYFIPYIFFKFPKRKEEAVNLAKSLNKKIYIFNNKKDATNFLSKIDASFGKSF